MEKILTMRKDRAKTDSEIRYVEQQIKNLKKDGTLKDLEIKMRQNGIMPGDPLWMRILAQKLESIEKSKPVAIVKEAVKTKAPERAPWLNPMQHIFGN